MFVRGVAGHRPPPRARNEEAAAAYAVVLHKAKFREGGAHFAYRRPIEVVVALADDLFAGERRYSGVVGRGVLDVHPPRDVAAKQNEVVLSDARAPIRAHFVEVVDPAVSEDVHRFLRGVGEMQVADGKNFHAVILPQIRDFATPKSKMSAGGARNIPFRAAVRRSVAF